MTPRFSIVITCYNYERYVAAAIESALAQAYENIEVIVVDDGSTDKSAQIIANYEGRIRSIRQPNQGSIAAYNRGYSETTGDVIVFLDADDLLFPEMATEVARIWSRRCVKVQYDLDIINGAGEDLGRKFCNFVDGYDAGRVQADFATKGTYRWPVTAGNAYSRWFLDIMMPLTVVHGPDGLMNTVAPIFGEVLTIPRSLASYRIHGKNMWASTGSDSNRLPVRIHHRQEEIRIMRKYAEQHGVAVPAVNPMDFELAFINYRLMALKMGSIYAGDEFDSQFKLWKHGNAALWSELLPFRVKIIHLLWLTVLCVSPRWFARHLITLRFNRSTYTQPFRRGFGVMSRRVRGSQVP